MSAGISAATTILFGSMSQQAGHTVTSYLPKRPDIFINAMHTVFWVATGIAIIALILTARRFMQQRAAH